MHLQKTTLRLPKKLYSEAKKEAAERGMAVRDVVSNSLQQYLQQPAEHRWVDYRELRTTPNRSVEGLKKFIDHAVKGGPANLSQDDTLLYRV